MNVIVLQVFVSLMLVAGSVLLFIYTVRSRTLEHADRLSLAPLEEDIRSAEPLPQSPQSKQPSLPEPPTPASESPARGPGEV